MENRWIPKKILTIQKENEAWDARGKMERSAYPSRGQNKPCTA
jgi:hypothetical protein